VLGLTIGMLVPTALMLLLVISTVRCLPRVQPAQEARPGAASVLIPARNEVDRLPACLDSLLLQDETVLEVLVYDDHSTDGTADLVRQYGQRDARIQLLAPVALPEGWCGKTFACAHLAGHARGEWLLFLDADTRLAPGGVAGIIAAAEEHRVTFLSPWPAFLVNTFWEKALLPMLSFVAFSLFPVRVSLEYQHASLGLAHGACILAHRETYRNVDGHQAVRGEICEDVCLARVWRARGHRGLCLDGQDVVAVRMYRSLREIWLGFQKNSYPAFRHWWSFWLFMAFHVWCFVLPFIFAPVVVTGRMTALPALLAVACILILRALLAIRFRVPLWSALAHPLAELMFVGVGVSSWWHWTRGKGVTWKGRAYSGRVP